MKPFNLQQAKAGKPVCTRDGHKARIVCWDAVDDDPNYKILALVEDDNRVERPTLYKQNGMLNLYDEERDLDLMMAGKKCQGWINIYNDEDTPHANTSKLFPAVRRTVGIKIYPTEQAALCHHDDDYYITTTKIEWEE